MIYIGIDPGITGAIAVLSNDKLFIYDMPLKPDKRINSVIIYELLLDYLDSQKIICYIEKSSAMPGQGVVSMFSYGVTYGKILAALEISLVSIFEISPRAWKKEFELINKKGDVIKKDKMDSVDKAIELFPKNEKDFWREKRGGGKVYLHGRAEATLIAEYGRRITK